MPYFFRYLSFDKEYLMENDNMQRLRSSVVTEQRNKFSWSATVFTIFGHVWLFPISAWWNPISLNEGRKIKKTYNTYFDVWKKNVSIRVLHLIEIILNATILILKIYSMFCALVLQDTFWSQVFTYCIKFVDYYQKGSLFKASILIILCTLKR